MARMTDAAIADAYAAGKSTIAISRHDGRSSVAIRARLMRMGVTLRSRREANPQTGITDAEVKAMLDAGIPQAEIARRAGVSRQRISARVARIRKGA